MRLCRYAPRVTRVFEELPVSVVEVIICSVGITLPTGYTRSGVHFVGYFTTLSVARLNSV
jgi:hypothetical protein